MHNLLKISVVRKKEDLLLSLILFFLRQAAINIFFVLCFYLFQKDGKSNTRAENNSSLPTSMSQARNHFPRADICEKFSDGPTSPNPGPIFISAEITELIAV